ncbi:MAG: Fur family transcriptional regulator [Microbacterium sp.]
MAHAVQAQDADGAIRAAGLRVTEPRRAVYDALAALPHASADEVFSRVRTTLSSTSPQAVYNVLSAFVDAGVARRIEPAGHPGLFELRVGDNHHHVVCTRCGRIDDIDCVHGAPPCMQPDDDHGYQIRSAEVTFWGVCPACAAT